MHLLVCMEDYATCELWNKPFLVISDTGKELIKILTEKRDFCIHYENTKLVIIVTWNIKNMHLKQFIEQNLANKDGYIVVQKVQEWRFYPHAFGKIYFLYLFYDMTLFKLN